MRTVRAHHPVAWLRDHPFFADSLLAALFAVVGIAGLWMAPDHAPSAIHWRDPDALGVVIVALQTVPLAWRRRRPDLVLLWVGTATVAYYAAGYAPSVGAPPLIAFYTLAAHRTKERMIWPGLAVLGGVLVIAILDRGPVGIGDLVSNVAIFAAAWFIGDNVRNRRARTAALVERAERLEREREANARQAVGEERARIARELHDVVAHSMSVMVVQAGAARRVMDVSPDEAREALLSIEDTGRQALDEMRRLLGVLRRDVATAPTDRSPQPSVRDLESLIEVVREAGLDVTVTVEGLPRTLPSGVDLSAYRVIQEALTNSLKHAGPAKAQVVLRWTDGWLELEVIDDGRGLGLAPAANGGNDGHGLVGMRERVSLYGGDLHVGPAPGGGFRVQASFPLADRPAAAGRP